MVADYLKFKGVASINEDLILNNLLYGVIDFYNWSMLVIGGYTNITRTPPISGVFGGQKFRLRPVKQDGYTNGQVWEGFRGNWVWETGIPVVTTQPIKPTGVWVNNIFQPATGVGSYSHYVDYPRGRVVFNTAVPVTSTIETEFSTRTVRFEPAESETVRRLMFDSWSVNRADFLLANSGNWSDVYDTRLQLPLIGVEVCKRSSFAPYQLGGGQYAYHDVVLYIITDNLTDNNQLTDILRMQNDRSIWLINRKTMKDAATYPCQLDYRGTPVASSWQYPELVNESGYRWTSAYLSNTTSYNLNIPNPSLFGTVVQTTVEIILESI